MTTTTRIRSPTPFHKVSAQLRFNTTKFKVTRTHVRHGILHTLFGKIRVIRQLVLWWPQVIFDRLVIQNRTFTSYITYKIKKVISSTVAVTLTLEKPKRSLPQREVEHILKWSMTSMENDESVNEETKRDAFFEQKNNFYIVFEVWRILIYYYIKDSRVTNDFWQGSTNLRGHR